MPVNAPRGYRGEPELSPTTPYRPKGLEDEEGGQSDRSPQLQKLSEKTRQRVDTIAFRTGARGHLDASIRFARSGLLGDLLGSACSRAKDNAFDAHFHDEDPFVVRPRDVDDDVDGLPSLGALNLHLELGLVVDPAFYSTDAWESRFDEAFDDATSGWVAAIEEDSGDDGFDQIGKDRFLLTATRLVFSATEPQ